MAGSKPSVGDFWKQLKTLSAPKSAAKSEPASFDKLWFSFNNDLPKKSAPVTKAKEAMVTQPQHASHAPTNSTAESTCSSDCTMVVSQPNVEGPHRSIEHCIASLKDTSAPVRRNALNNIKGMMSSADDATVQEWSESQLGKALLRRFDDAGESCRELAVGNFTTLLQRAPQCVLAMLPYAMPVLEERLCKADATKGMAEPSEEVRLQLARLLALLISFGGKTISAYAGEAVEMVYAMCEDPFYEVNVEACNVVWQLNAVLGARLQPVAKQLVAALLQLIVHNRHRVRVAAIQAVRVVMFHGAHEMILEMVAFRDPNVIPVKAFYGDDLKINFCGKLSSDAHPQVRLEFLRMVGDWMLHLVERLDHEPRLLPYVVSALNDENPSIQAEALQLLDQLGQQYEKEHEKELKDIVTYLPDEAHALGWVDEQPGPSYVYGGGSSGVSITTMSGSRQLLVLPGPCSQRPRLGTRILVQANFGRVVHPLASELGSWQEDPRRRAALLLRTNLVFVEDAVHQHLQLLIPALCRAVADPELGNIIADCCTVIACFTPLPLLLQLLAPQVQDEGTELRQRAAALEVLAHCIRGAGPRGEVAAHIASVMDLLESGRLLSTTDKACKASLANALQHIIDACGPACQGCTDRLLLACLYVRSSPYSIDSQSTEQADNIEGLMCKLAAACSFSSSYDMIAESRTTMLSKLDFSSNAPLDLHVLARLTLSSSKHTHLLTAPQELLLKVRCTNWQGGIEAPACFGGTAVGTDETPSSNGLDAAVHATTDVNNASTSGCAEFAEEQQRPHAVVGLATASSSEPSTSTSTSSTGHIRDHNGLQAIVHALKRVVQLLPGHPRSAQVLLLCFEQHLLSLAATDCRRHAAAAAAANCQPACSATDPGQLLSLLHAIVGLPGLELLGMRCLQAALQAHVVLVLSAAEPADVQQLVDLLASHTAADSIACRLQACNTICTLAASIHARDSSPEHHTSRTALTAALAGAVLPQLLQRLYDAQDQVQGAAIYAMHAVLQLLQQQRQQQQQHSEGCSEGAKEPARQVQEADRCYSLLQETLRQVACAKDVVPGSIAMQRKQALLRWAEQHANLPAAEQNH